MTINVLIAVIPVILGTVAIVVSIARSKMLFMAMPFVMSRGRAVVEKFLKYHRLLLILFLVGYSVLGIAIGIRVKFLSEYLIGAMSFLVAAFIYLGSLMEVRMLSEIHKTLNGLLPICSVCRKMRSPDSDAQRQDSWLPIEKFIAKEIGARLTHSFCPECMGKAIENIAKDEDPA